jgi:hypothetical protein
MVSARSTTALLGLVASLALSVVLWVVFGVPAFLAVVPFVPFVFRRGDCSPVRECPVCGFRTRDPEFEHCPRDGHRLER